MGGVEVSMSSQEVFFSMVEMSSGSWAVWFGFFGSFTLLICALFRPIKFGVRQFISMAGDALHMCQERLPSIGGQMCGFSYFE